MMRFCGSIALIRRIQNEQAEWLAVWHDQRQQFEFIRSEILEGDSFRECLDREIAWELQLDRGRDYVISSVARLHAEIPVDEAGDDECHVVEFFVTELYGSHSREAVNATPRAVWLTTAEVLAGQSMDGRPVDPLLVDWLKHADVIAPHRY